MAVRTRTREVETTLPKVVEQKADYHKSGGVASEHNGTRVKLERLPQLLNDPDFVKTIEGTESYKRNGYTWFWTDTVGTNLSGYYKINPKGKTLDEMFEFISKEFESKVQAVPFNERAYFYKGSQPLSVSVGGSDVDGRRLLVYGDDRLDVVAPVVVVEQAQASSQAQVAEVGSFYKISKEGVLEPVKVTAQEAEQLAKTQGLRLLTLDEAVKMASSGLVVPTEKFNAAKEAFRKVGPTMHPDLADAFRAVFGE